MCLLTPCLVFFPPHFDLTTPVHTQEGTPRASALGLYVCRLDGHATVCQQSQSPHAMWATLGVLPVAADCPPCR